MLEVPHSRSLLPHGTQPLPEPCARGALHLHFILGVPSGPGDPAVALFSLSGCCAVTEAKLVRPDSNPCGGPSWALALSGQ